MNLNAGTRLILRKIQAAGELTTSDLKDDDDITEHYEPSSLRKPLNRLAENDYLEKENTSPRTYTITEKGKKELREHRERKRRQLLETGTEGGSSLDLEDAVDRFQTLFSTDEFEERIGEAVASGSDVFELSFDRVYRFDADLAEYLLRNPEDALNGAEVAIGRTSFDELDADIAVTDLPDDSTKEIRELEVDDIGRLVAVPGIVLKASMIKPAVVSATFRCTSCGTIRDEDQDIGTKVKSPYKCECGNRQWEEIDREYEPVRVLKLQEKPDSPDQKKIKVRISGRFAESETVREMRPGTAVKVVGIVEAEDADGRKSGLPDPYIQGVYVDGEQEKWDEIELSEEDRERNQEIAEAGAVEELWSSVAADRLVHRELMRKAFILYLLGKTEKGNLHALVFGDPGTGKTNLVRWAEENLPHTIMADATGASAVGLTATVKEDPEFGGYVAEGGSLTLADRGYHMTDEFSRLHDDHYPQFNEALEHGTVSIDKGDISNLKLDAAVSEWAISNPRNADKLDASEEAYKQIPIPSKYEATKQRFELIIALREYPADSEEYQDILEFMASNEEERPEPEYSPEQIVKFVTEASRIDPEITDEARDLLMQQFQTLKESEREGERLISTRGYRALLVLSIAFARAELSDSVERRHAEQACDFYRRTLESMDFTLGDDSFTDVQSQGRTNLKQVKQAIEDLVDEYEDDTVPIEDIADEIGMPVDKVGDILEEGSDKGEFYEPRNGRWKVL